MHFGDDHSHHPWQGPVLRGTTEEISESLAGLLYQVFLQLFGIDCRSTGIYNGDVQLTLPSLSNACTASDPGSGATTKANP